MNDVYKKHHKPIMDDTKTKYHQGYFHPTHPEKCLTKENVYRSGWEFKFLKWCDECPQILRYASEPIAVKYRNPVANLKYCIANGLNPQDPRNWKIMNYYTDMWIELQTAEGNVRKIFIEIKPFSQTQPPKPINENASIKEHNAYNKAAQTYLVNREKWKAAAQYFNERGAEFMIMTEKSLSKLCGVLN